MTPSMLSDLATVALVGLIAFVSLPLVTDLSSWLFGAGLFGGAYLLSFGLSVLLTRWQRAQRAPVPDGEGAGD